MAQGAQSNGDVTMNRRKLSERDSVRVLSLLKTPPGANDRLVRVAKAGFVLPPPVPTTDAPKREI